MRRTRAEQCRKKWQTIHKVKRTFTFNTHFTRSQPMRETKRRTTKYQFDEHGAHFTHRHLFTFDLLLSLTESSSNWNIFFRPISHQANANTPRSYYTIRVYLLHVNACAPSPQSSSKACSNNCPTTYSQHIRLNRLTIKSMKITSTNKTCTLF